MFLLNRYSLGAWIYTYECRVSDFGGGGDDAGEKKARRRDEEGGAGEEEECHACEGNEEVAFDQDDADDAE